MNKQNRAELLLVIDDIIRSRKVVKTLAEGEWEKYYNLERGLKYTADALNLEENAYDLNSILSSLDAALHTLKYNNFWLHDENVQWPKLPAAKEQRRDEPGKPKPAHR